MYPCLLPRPELGAILERGLAGKSVPSVHSQYITIIWTIQHRVSISLLRVGKNSLYEACHLLRKRAFNFHPSFSSSDLQKDHLEIMSADFWAGYLSGAAGILIGNPLDLVKVRLQAGECSTTPDRAPLSASQQRSFSSLLRGRFL